MFRDIQEGRNFCGTSDQICCHDGFEARPGYDILTGRYIFICVFNFLDKFLYIYKYREDNHYRYVDLIRKNHHRSRLACLLMSIYIYDKY